MLETRAHRSKNTAKWNVEQPSPPCPAPEPTSGSLL